MMRIVNEVTTRLLLPESFARNNMPEPRLSKMRAKFITMSIFIMIKYPFRKLAQLYRSAPYVICVIIL